MKIALVHDYLREYGGAERVVEALHEIFPQAPLFTAYYDPKGLETHAEKFKGWDIRTSWLQKIPGANKLLSPLRILAPTIFKGFDLSSYDLVISSCNIYFSKAVKIGPKTLHLSYIHTPPRYLYGYTTSFNYKKHWWTKVGGELMNYFLRIWDFEISQKPDILIANSKNVQARIKKFYRRESVVIYPPVKLRQFSTSSNLSDGLRTEGLRSLRLDEARPGAMKKDYFLSVGRLVRGKGTEIIIEACGKLGLPLKVVGTGPEREGLESRVKSQGYKNIEFVGSVDDQKITEFYAQAKATIVASEDEDFGIVPVESMSMGTPVVALKAGGFLETVINKKTGLFFDKANVESLMEALKCFNDLNHDIKPEDCRKQAEKFSKERFKKEILNLVSRTIKERLHA